MIIAAISLAYPAVTSETTCSLYLSTRLRASCSWAAILPLGDLRKDRHSSRQPRCTSEANRSRIGNGTCCMQHSFHLFCVVSPQYESVSRPARFSGPTK